MHAAAVAQIPTRKSVRRRHNAANYIHSRDEERNGRGGGGGRNSSSTTEPPPPLKRLADLLPNSRRENVDLSSYTYRVGSLYAPAHTYSVPRPRRISGRGENELNEEGWRKGYRKGGRRRGEERERSYKFLPSLSLLPILRRISADL